MQPADRGAPQPIPRSFAPRWGPRRRRVDTSARAGRLRDRQSEQGRRGSRVACCVRLEDSGSEGWGYAPIISVKTQPTTAAGSPALTLRPAASEQEGGVGVLDARPGGPAARLAARLGAHPAIVFIVAMLAGLLVIAAASIGAGLLVTRVIEHASGIGAADERVNVWLAAHRTPGRTHAVADRLDRCGWRGAADPGRA